MKTLIFLLGLIPLIVIGQPAIDEFNWKEINYKMFNKSDLNSKNITNVLVYGIEISKQSMECHSDTLYLAEFDSLTNIKKETIFSKDFPLSGYRKLIKQYSYINDETIITTINNYHHSIEQIVLNQNENPVAEWDISANGKKHKTAEYFYDRKNRLIERKSHYISYKYYYNNHDSIIKLAKIYNADGLTDSIMSYYVYDTENRMIEHTQSPSSTFCQSFPLLCDTGNHSFSDLYTYDTCNSSNNNNENKYSARINVFDFGYKKSFYYNSELYKLIYTKDIKENTVKENYDNKTRIISYDDYCNIKKTDCLPVRIEFLDQDFYWVYDVVYK